MSYQLINRCSIIAGFAILISGCSILGSSDAPQVGERSEQCRHSPSSCMYNGKYEPGERAYAEREAARLNRESLERLRRRAG
ncbi:MAG: hypothetical protein AB7E55_09765 [Pigmentiphaga sp.]